MDNLITDLLAKRNFSQAKKAIEKKLKQKKSEGDHGLLVRLTSRWDLCDFAYDIRRLLKQEHYSVWRSIKHA